MNSLQKQAHEDVMKEADEKCFAEMRRLAETPRMTVEVYQQDWCPGFAAFLDDGSVQKGTAHICLNVGALMAAVEAKDVEKADLPYLIAESMMHEIIHALEAWAGVEFSEEKVEALLEAYRVKYGKGVAVEETVVQDLGSWGGKLIDELPACGCGGRPQAEFLDHAVQGQIPYVLKCKKCLHKIGSVDMEACILNWVIENDPDEMSKWVQRIIPAYDADMMEGQG